MNLAFLSVLNFHVLALGIFSERREKMEQPALESAPFAEIFPRFRSQLEAACLLVRFKYTLQGLRCRDVRYQQIAFVVERQATAV